MTRRTDTPVALVTSNYYETGTKDLESMTAGDETLSYTWYEDGLKKTETWSGTVEGTIKWDYDSNRKPEQITVGTETPIAFGYDEFQRISSVGALDFDYYETDLDNLSTDSGKLALVALNDSAVNYYYDNKGLPFETSYSQSGVETFKLSYTLRDDRDRITAIEETENDVTTVKKYRYDTSDRLWRVEDADGNALASYFYDVNGNRTRHYTATTDVNYTYNAQDQLTQMGTTLYTYTLNGELKTKTDLTGITVYNHDPMGNLIQVVLPNSRVIGYTYDAKNRRVAKTMDGVIQYRLIYSDQLAPAAKVDADGNVLEEYVYALGVNSPDYIKKDGVNYRVIKDHLGSMRMVVDSNTGNIEKTIAYDEFGNVTSETGDFDILFGFAGGLQDRDTGLVKFGARDYDPKVGRWTSKEPLGFEGALNFYAYVSNDPINKIDPTGLAEVYFLMNFSYYEKDERERHWEIEVFDIQLKAQELIERGFDVHINYQTSYEGFLNAFSDNDTKLIYTTGHGFKDFPGVHPNTFSTYISPMDIREEIQLGENLEVVIMNHCHQGNKTNRAFWEKEAFPNVNFIAPRGTTYSEEAYNFLYTSFPGCFDSIISEKSGMGSLIQTNVP